MRRRSERRSARHDRRRHPARERHEPVAAEPDVTREDELAEARLVRVGRRREVGNARTTREQDPGFLPRLADRGDDERRPMRAGRVPEWRRHQPLQNPGVGVAIVDRSAGEHVEAWAERHRRGPMGQEHLRAAGRVTQDRHRRRRPRDRPGDRHPGIAGVPVPDRHAPSRSASSASGSWTGWRHAKSRHTNAVARPLSANRSRRSGTTDAAGSPVDASTRNGE